MLAWGGGNVLIAAVPMSGIAVAFYRLAFGSLLYMAVMYAKGNRLSRATFAIGWRGGVAFGLNLAAFFVALRFTSVASATTIGALQPLMIMGFAAVMFGERIRARHAISAVAATAGVAMVAFGAASGSSRGLLGDALAVLALIGWAWYFIASKKARQQLDTLEYMTVANMVAFVCVAPMALVTGDLFDTSGRLDVGTFLAIWLIVLVPGSGHLLMNWAHNHTTLLLSSLITLAMPVISTITAALFLDQSVTAVQVGGIAVVLAALAVVILGDTRQRLELEPTE